MVRNRETNILQRVAAPPNIKHIGETGSAVFLFAVYANLKRRAHSDA